MFDSIVLDLDGTLWDSSASCAIGWNRVLTRHGIPFRPVTTQDIRAVNGKVEWSEVGGCFRDFECWGSTGLSKAQNLRLVINRNGLRSPVFVGDTAGDQTAARECGVSFFHAAYGFGECSGADRRFASFTALTEWLLESIDR